MLDQTVQFEDVDAFELEMEHFDDLKAELGYDTTWSMGSGVMALDQKIFSDKIRVVTYKCIAEMGDTMDDVTWMTFTAVAMNGTVGELWKAAENCFQQAKAALGDWHYFVEDFDVQEDGTLELVTGS
tara:strand:+ start:38 stop:418 length:381 start_codon:yes stop_codon:yes gene_type:complete